MTAFKHVARLTIGLLVALLLGPVLLPLAIYRLGTQALDGIVGPGTPETTARNDVGARALRKAETLSTAAKDGWRRFKAGVG